MTWGEQSMFFIRQDTGVLEVEFSGELSPGFMERLRRLVEASGLMERGIVFDLARLLPGDPGALWELVSFLLELEQRQISVHIRTVNPDLYSLLSVVRAPGLDKAAESS